MKIRRGFILGMFCRKAIAVASYRLPFICTFFYHHNCSDVTFKSTSNWSIKNKHIHMPSHTWIYTWIQTKYNFTLYPTLIKNSVNITETSYNFNRTMWSFMHLSQYVHTSINIHPHIYAHMHICTYKHAHLCTLVYIYPLTQTNTELTSIYDPADQIYQQHISVNQKTF